MFIKIFKNSLHEKDRIRNREEKRYYERKRTRKMKIATPT